MWVKIANLKMQIFGDSNVFVLYDHAFTAKYMSKTMQKFLTSLNSPRVLTLNLKGFLQRKGGQFDHTANLKSKKARAKKLCTVIAYYKNIIAT